MTGLNRRELLKAVGTGAAATGLAGCLGGEDGGVATSTTPGPGSETPTRGAGASAGSKPEALPPRSSLDLYSGESPLNRRIPADAALDPDSRGYVDLLVEVGRAGGFVIELQHYSSPVYVADAETPTRAVRLACGPRWEMGVEYLRDVPIPEFAEPADDPINGAPIPRGTCGEDAGPDDQMVVLDPESRCELDFWQMREEGGEWVASWGNSTSMDGTGIYEKGLSARGSGFSTLSGLIWPDELEAGRIEHALIFSYPYPKAGGPVAPATESDGFSTREYALPEGARVRLDPDLDLSTLSLAPAEATIARALQEYGMFLVDRGGSGAGGEATEDDAGGISTEAVDPKSVRGNPYEGLLPDVAFPPLENVPLDRLQVLELPPQDPDANEESDLVPSGCGHME